MSEASATSRLDDLLAPVVTRAHAVHRWDQEIAPLPRPAHDATDAEVEAWLRARVRLAAGLAVAGLTGLTLDEALACFGWLDEGSAQTRIGLDIRDGRASLWIASVQAVDRSSLRALAACIVSVLAGMDDKDKQSGAPWAPPPPGDPAAIAAAIGPGAGPMDLAAALCQQAERSPQACAIRWRGGEIDYRDLMRAGTALAAELIRLGGAAPRVALLAARSPEAVLACVASVLAGGSYVPIDIRQPPTRQHELLRDCAATVLLHEAGTLTGTTFDSLPMRELEPVRSWLADSPSAPPPPLDRLSDGSSVACLMYTSGSTGMPKAVLVPDRAVLRLVIDGGHLPLGPRTRMLHAAPLGFDAATLEIWGPLLNGGCCVVHPEPVPSGPGLARTIAQLGANTAWLTAALFNAIVDDDPAHLRGLEHLITGGEALSVAHVRRAIEALPDCRIYNGYGPTECTTFACCHRFERAPAPDDAAVPIGRPIRETAAFIVSRTGHALPDGFVGELCLGGTGLALGYHDRPALSAEAFRTFEAIAPGARLYRTGDLAWRRDDGALCYAGRADRQFKLRGFRIEPGEIEAALTADESITQAAVMMAGTPARLLAYLVGRRQSRDCVLARLRERLPDYMLPSDFVWLERFPLTPNGKLDRRALPAPTRTREALEIPFREPQPGLESLLCKAFAQALGIERVGADDPFFALGGDSLTVVHAVSLLRHAGEQRVAVADFFDAATPSSIARSAQESRSEELPAPARAASRSIEASAARPVGPVPVAIIAMDGRFPGADDVAALWQMLIEGREGIRFFRPGEIDPSIPASMREDPNYVHARGVIDGAECFDAAFFGISPREAELMDPQHRVFLELCWRCLERAGYVPDEAPGPVGIFAGMYNASYYRNHVLTHPEHVARWGEFATMLANEKDYLATRVAHRLNLTGPAIGVYTACSTSLVAIANAFDSLQTGGCRMALAGGVSITCPPASGYLHEDGAMLSPDGHTRSFDEAAAGTVFSDGAAVVLLKRLDDALADGDPILALVRSSAINNDGAHRASFTAPTVQGQHRLIRHALDRIGLDARNLSYVEAHGTATPLGDPIEVRALKRAFAADTDEVGFCRLGSIKSQLGHCVIAAGATGVIKTVAAMRHQMIPGTLHFRSPNPSLELDDSPFVVDAHPSPWPRVPNVPRRAGVSAFGVGGTNAHVILEEAPARGNRQPHDGSPVILRLSAASETALAGGTNALSHWLEQPDAPELNDVAYTLAHGRKRFAYRTAVLATDRATAIAALRDPRSPRRFAAKVPREPAPVVLMFPGQGAQYRAMGRMLYRVSPAFAAAFDAVSDLLAPVLGFDLARRVFDPQAPLSQTRLTQPAIFALEYALACHWRAAGVRISAVLGHSVGEFAAAAIAGVMRMEDAARLIAARAALMQEMPAGAMLSCALPAQALQERLEGALSMAADNAPGASVASGPIEAIERLERLLSTDGIACKRLTTSHAFHSAMMDPVCDRFEQQLSDVVLSSPSLPMFSSLTGERLDDTLARMPRYWSRQLREPVRFGPALASLASEFPDPVLIEAGPGTTLSGLARRQPALSRALVLACLGHEDTLEQAQMLDTQARLWCHGIETTIPESGARVELPPYAFDRTRHWLDAPAYPTAAGAARAPGAVATELPAAGPPHTATEQATESPMTAPRFASTGSQREQLALARLYELFADVSGLELAQADPNQPFLSLGLDSLALTQAALQLKRSFGIQISFRQLMNDYPSFASLASHLAPTIELPASAPADSPATRQVAPAPTGAAMTPRDLQVASGSGAGDTLVRQVIEQQMALMRAQLELLAGTGNTLPMPTPMPTADTTVAAGTAPAAPTSTAIAIAQDSPEPAPRPFGAIARIEARSQREPSARQQSRLRTFIERYVARTAASKQYTERHRPHLADPRVVTGFKPAIKEITYPIVVERSRGAYLWDLDGNEYVDALNGFGMNLFGWQPAFVNDAVRAQLDAGYEIGPQHPLAGELADGICAMTGFERAALCNTGSEAVMGATRIARTVTGRSKIVIFSGAYHGIFDEVIVRAGRGGRAQPAAPGIMASSAANVVVIDYAAPDALEQMRAIGDDLAAVLVEPVQSRRPDLRPIAFLRELRDFTRANGSLLIFDEVVTGFRVHPAGVRGLYGLDADLATYGKVIGGGYPIGVIAGRRECMDALDGGHWQFGDDSVPEVGVTYFAGTFVRHPLALAAATAVLRHLEAAGPGLQQQLNERTDALVERLNAYCASCQAPVRLTNFGSVWRIEFTEDHLLQELLFPIMRTHGVHLLDGFPCFLTTAHGEAEIHRIETAFKSALAELQTGGFLPGRSGASLLDANRPPREGARLGRDEHGQPAWYVPDPNAPGQYLKLDSDRVD